MIFSKRKDDPHHALIETISKQYRERAVNYSAQPKSLPIYEELADMSPQARANFLVDFPKIVKPTKQGKNWQFEYFLFELYSLLMRRKNDFDAGQLLDIIETIRKRHHQMFWGWPIGWIVNQLGKSIKAKGLSDEHKQAWQEVSKWSEFDDEGYWGTDPKKVKAKLWQMVADEDDVIADYPLGQTQLAAKIKADLADMPTDTRNDWNALFYLAAAATGAKPTKKFSEPITAAIDGMGAAAFKKSVVDWLQSATMGDSFHISGNEEHWDFGRPDSEIQDLLKGLVWSMARFHDENSLAIIAKLAEKCFDRLPGVGPAAAGLGNAAIYTLAISKGLSGVAHLSRLKLRIKQNNTQKLIQTSIEQQAQRLGLKAAEIEDMAAPDFGLELGVREYAFDDYTLRLEASDVGQATLTWLKPDGSVQKSVPAFIKTKAAHKKKLADARALVKDIKKASTAQRDRIDRLYTEDMSWQPELFEKYYLNHGLIGPMARKLVWCLEIDGSEQPALFYQDGWQDVSGQPITGQPTEFKLWHPIMSDTETILAWRARMEDLQIRQPLKQTFREVYLLTDAEIATKSYSNRMAAHLLKQHQFNTLAAIRGWKYSLLGCYDDGRDNEIASKPLPAYQLSAEFWIDEIYDMEDSFNEAGIWDYVATDQVRFNNDSGEVIDLIDVPPIVLSEILRDTDLFVGVASIGNDPTWNDRGGAPRTVDYWQSYSFGDLSETAKTRKTVLENLIPRLKIRDIAKIDGRYLVVKGKRHTYKIHIGSGNILIVPQDRYLCIVPGRGKDKNLDKLYLPFEGDRGLSIVLSKAFMLADDDKITDETILSQL